MFDLLSHEIRRKAIHITGSLIPVFYYFTSKGTAIIVFSLLMSVLLIVELLHLKGKIQLPRILLRPVALFVYLAGALGATFGDSVHIRISGVSVDDNLVIPLLSGTFMSALI